MFHSPDALQAALGLLDRQWREKELDDAIGACYLGLDEDGLPDAATRHPRGLVYEPMDLSGTGLRWGPAPVSRHGGQSVFPGRPAPAGHPAAPEHCTDTSGSGVWLLDGRLLICPAYGMDST